MTRKRRRTKGSGSITFDRARQKYIARLPDTGIGTPPKRQFASEAEAQSWLDQKRRDSADGVAVKGIPTLTQWLDHCQLHIWHVKATTAESYADIIRARIAPHLGRYKLDALERSPETIERWLAELRRQGYAYNSIKVAFRLVRRALTIAVKRDKIRKNPTDTIELRAPDVLDEDVRRGYAMAPAEAARFLAVIGIDHRLYALYFVALATGMRQAELIGLRWRYVQLVEKNGERAHIRIVEEIRRVAGKLVRLPPKSTHAKRLIWLDDETVRVLSTHRMHQHDEKMRWRADRPDWNSDDLVFPNELGGVFWAENLRTHFKAALIRAYGLPEDRSRWTVAQKNTYAIRFHDLRHTAGSLMLLAGSSIADVKEILGHSSVAITAGIYLHSYDETKLAAVAGAAKLIRGVA